MRIIKFRAWDIPTNKMLDWEDFRDIMNMGNFDNNEVIYMQFTGLKDKNGKEIYEGDIVKVTDNEKVSRNIEIRFENHHIGDFHNWEIHGFRDYSKSTYGFEVEVIGNIYENPELLK